MAAISSIQEKEHVRIARAARFGMSVQSSAQGGDEATGYVSSILKRLGGAPEQSSITPSMTSRIKGKSQELEKPYFRLTGALDKNSIRPENILRLSLENVKKRYSENEDYSYFCEQLKSIRQDLTVQTKTGPFAAHVYETHARVALMHGDLDEYNQCQSRLLELRASGTIAMSIDEFDCYRILYCLHVGSKLEMSSMLKDIQSDICEEKEWQRGTTSATGFAFDVVNAVHSNNTYRFFKLYQEARDCADIVVKSMALAPYNCPYSSKPAISNISRSNSKSIVSCSSTPSTKRQCYQAVFLMDFLVLRLRLCTLQQILKGYMVFGVSDLYEKLHFQQESDFFQFVKTQHLVLVSHSAADPSQSSLESVQSSNTKAVQYLDCKSSVTARLSAAAAGSGSRAHEGGQKKRICEEDAADEMISDSVMPGVKRKKVKKDSISKNEKLKSKKQRK